MTLKKAYIHITISLMLIVMSIVLFALHLASDYVFWYHIAFYISVSIALLLGLSAVVLLSKKHQHVHEKVLDTLDWMTFITQSFSVILVVFMFFMFSSTVQQSSMYPTLQEGNIVIATQFNYEPKRHDIIIINVDPMKHPGESEKLLVKRIAGMPGDSVEFAESPVDDGYKIIINGEIYTHEGSTYIARYISSEKEIIEASLDNTGHIKDGEYLVFGDNEANSKDSRNLGTFEKEDIIGHVIFRLWPFGGLS